MPDIQNTPAIPAAPVAPATPAIPAAPAPAPAPSPSAPPNVPAGTTAPVAPKGPTLLEQALASVKPSTTWADLTLPDTTPAQPLVPVGTQATPAPVVDVTGRVHDPANGQFVSPQAAVTAPEPGLPDTTPQPVGDPLAPPAVAPDAAPADVPNDAPQANDTPGIPIVLTDRNGREVEIEVTDPDLAETLRMWKNNGLRRDQYDKEIAPVREQQQQMQQFVATWETTPEVVFDQLRPDLQERLGRYILATRFDQDFETIKQFAEDGTARREALVDIRGKIQQGNIERDQRLTAMQQAERVSAAVRSLVPAGADDAKAAQFLSAAASMITGMIHQRQPVTPELVPQLLAPLRSAYGLTESPTPQPPAAQPPAASPPDDLAARRQAAAATVQRLQRTAQQRQVAAAVAPQGAGVAPVVAPMPPQGATLNQVTDFLKQRFKPGMTWSDVMKP